MAEKISVAKAKSRFSELLGRVCYAHERFVIERKGKPVAALVDINVLRQAESIKTHLPPQGLLAAVGAWKSFKNLDEVVESIYRQRTKSKDRTVQL